MLVEKRVCDLTLRPRLYPRMSQSQIYNVVYVWVAEVATVVAGVYHGLTLVHCSA